MGNTLERITDYHAETSHRRGKLFGRKLDRAEFPVPFKRYQNLPVFPLPEQPRMPRKHLDTALQPGVQSSKCDINIVSSICRLSCGISRSRPYADGSVFHYRTVASAGGLYPAEFYLSLQNIRGIEDGLYHYSPYDHALTQLRRGYPFGVLRGGGPIIRGYISSMFHRSSWKYGPRAYRYCLLDAGHLLENSIMAGRLFGLPSKADVDFNDRRVNDYLCLDAQYEACLAMVHFVGCSPATDVDETIEPTGEDLGQFSRSAPVAKAPDELLGAHRLTSSFARCPVRSPAPAPEGGVTLNQPVIDKRATTAILERRSSRNFVPRAIPAAPLKDIVSFLCHDVPPVCTDAVRVGFLAAEHSEFAPGQYRIHRPSCSYHLVQPGSYMGESARVCLDQQWLSNAAAHFVFTADIESLNRNCGPRAYRYAQLQAGRLGQRIYVAAQAKGLGACGIGAFFDGEAANLLSLPSGHALLYLVAVGPVQR